MYKAIRFIIYLLAFSLCIALVVVGQRSIGWWGIGVMMSGLSGLIILLAIYNKKYK